MALKLHTSASMIVLLSIGMMVASAPLKDIDYDHYRGIYAYEATPYWAEFQVVKDGNDLIVQEPDSQWKMALERSEGTLLAAEDDGEVMRLSYEPAVKQYCVAVTVRTGRPGERITMSKRTLVKLQPNPNDRLETTYGVTAADLVRRVRASEDWIHQVQSLQIKAQYTWTRTPGGIAHRRKEIRAKWPDADFSDGRLWDTSPEQKGELFVAFDRWRFHTHLFEPDKTESLRLWNGQEFMAHEKHFARDQEHYSLERHYPDPCPVLIHFMWPRAQYHSYWWKTPLAYDWEDFYAQAEEFILAGRQKYRGIPCYVVECFPKDLRRIRRWFVGIQDGLLYGSLMYEEGQLSQEHWTGAYKEVAPACWFPMQQGYHIFKQNEKLDYFIATTRDMTITEVTVDETLPSEFFAMEFKDGVKVNDNRFGGWVTYEYRKDRTETEWAEIRQRAQARQEEKSAEQRALDSRIGQTALEFPAECRWLHTEPLTMQSLRGKAVILQFWGIWCGPCHNYMSTLSPAPDGSDVIVIGVHTPTKNLDEIEADMDKYSAAGPVCVDAGQRWGTISQWYHVRRRPYWVVIDPDSRVLGHFAQPAAAFRAARQALPPTKKTD